MGAAKRGAAKKVAPKKKKAADAAGMLQCAAALETDGLIGEKYQENLEAKLINMGGKRHYTPPVFARPSVVRFVLSAVVSTVGFGALFAAGGFFGTAAFLYQSSRDIWDHCVSNGLSGLYIGLCGGFLFALAKYCAQWYMAESRHKKEMKEYKQTMRNETARLEREKALKTRLEPLPDIAQKAVGEAKQAAAKLYDKLNVPEDLQNLPAVATMADYLRKGTCTALGGAVGAFEMYRTRAATGEIVADVGTAFEAPDALKEHQPLLYEEITRVAQALPRLSAIKGDTPDEQAADVKRTLFEWEEESRGHIAAALEYDTAK